LSHLFAAIEQMTPEDQQACMTLAALTLECERPPDIDYEDSAALAGQRNWLQAECRCAAHARVSSEDAFTHFLACGMLGWCWHFANPRNAPRSAERLRRAAELSAGDLDVATSLEELANNARGEALGWQRRYEAFIAVVVRGLLDQSELRELG
jgi:hypothetical protein